MNTFIPVNHMDVPTAPSPQPKSKFERLLTPRQVASWLGVSDRWVRDHATRRKPRIPTVKLGSLLRFRPEDVEEFIAQQRSDASAQRRWQR